ncbi:ComEA family DNA-binding protein [Chitinophaga solisilvae]|uniref:ComEA family DNA-binding protein n=1 Tax=Chitinophaga solisilvae TaxID=1233460 RepID=UPI00137104AE|nr:helix-hairpin-helix domain-containing protein [Chitinophaga solisilvae]
MAATGEVVCKKSRPWRMLTGCCWWLLSMAMPATARQQEEALPAAMENTLENETAGKEAVPEDDADWQQLNAYARHRIQLNTADAAALQSLGILTPLLVNNFLTYRRLLGNLVSIYELQAVPGFDPDIIRQMLPYVKVGDDLEPHYSWYDYLHKGDHTLLLRVGWQPEKSKGYLHTDSTLPHYAGNPLKAFVRYRYNFPRRASWGVTMEKDAGEPFLKGTQRYGFDFYSAHCFIRNRGALKALALGDYTVNMGQGLLNWQSQAYSKGAAVMQIKREGEILRPYTSAGEYYFFRGAAVTLEQGIWQTTAFVSLRRLDGHVNTTDTAADMQTATSLISSGYHRSATEMAAGGTLQQLSGGANIRCNTRRWQAGANVMYHRLTPALEKTPAPYNQFDFSGQQLLSGSIDYAAAYRNIHFFGEAALSSNGKPAIVQGLLASLAPAADMAIIYRYYDKAYQSLYAKGFGDGYRTANEQGLYMAASLKMHARLRVDGYMDIFTFPWLKYRASAPSGGKEYMAQATWSPAKTRTLVLRYIFRQGSSNEVIPDNPVKVLSEITSGSIRIIWSQQCNKQWSIRSRLSGSRYASAAGKQQGWMLAQDVGWKCRAWPLGINARIAWFFTDSYDTRLYAYESSVLYDNAVSQLYGSGWQYYINLRWKVNKRLTCWARLHQTIYSGVATIGSGWDVIEGNKKTMLQCQLIHSF